MSIILPNLNHSFVPVPFPDSGFRIPDSGFRIPDFLVFHTPNINPTSACKLSLITFSKHRNVDVNTEIVIAMV